MGKKDDIDLEPEIDDNKMVAEKEMTDDQMKKREEIVKSMKKEMPRFKKKYGDRAKDVMYATATKMAMKEGFKLTEEDFAELDEAKQKPYVSSDRDGKHVMTGSGKIAKTFKDMDSANAYLKKNYNKLMKEEVDEGRGRPSKSGAAGGDLENIQMQLRKSISLRGAKDVEFEDGKKVKVPEKVARTVLAGIDKMRQPKDKQNVVNYIMKSQKNLMDFAAGKVKMDDMDPEAKRKKLLGLK